MEIILSLVYPVEKRAAGDSESYPGLTVTPRDRSVAGNWSCLVR